MNSIGSDVSSSRRPEWGQLLVTAIGTGLVVLGARGFLLRGHFGSIDAVYCILMLVPAAVLLLLGSFIVQHARLVAVMPLFIALLLVLSSPAFSVALGFALLWAIVGPILGKWTPAVKRNRA